MRKTPQQRTGPMFFQADNPNVNDLAAGIVGDFPAEIHGTDPAPFARGTMVSWLGWETENPNVANQVPENGGAFGLPSLETVLRGVGGTLLGLIILALGIWYLIK